MVECPKVVWCRGTSRLRRGRSVRAGIVIVAVVISAYGLWFTVDVLASGGWREPGHLDRDQHLSGAALADGRPLVMIGGTIKQTVS